MTKEEYIKHQSERLEIDYDQYIREMPYSYVVYNMIFSTCTKTPSGDICVYGSYEEAENDCVPPTEAIIREDYFVEQYLHTLS